MAEDKAPELSKALKDAGYSMKNGVQPGPAMIPTPGGGWLSVDFRTMTVEQAEELIASGYKEISKDKEIIKEKDTASEKDVKSNPSPSVIK